MTQPHSPSTNLSSNPTGKGSSLPGPHRSYQRQNRQTSTQFVLNASPIRFDDVEMRVGVIPYESGDQLTKLRDTHGATHVFRRQKRREDGTRPETQNPGQTKDSHPNEDGTEIIAAPFVVDAPELGEEFRTLKLKQELGLAAALIRNGLINHLHTMPRKVFDYSPITFLADESKENLLQKALPAGVACPDWLSICPLYEADVRVFHFDRQAAFVGACLSVRTKRQINRTCDKLIEDRFPLHGHYVKKRVISHDARIQPEFPLLGRVDSIDGSVLRLSDYRENENSVQSSEAYVELSSFDAVLRHAFGHDYDRIHSSLEDLLVDFRKGPARLTRLRAICSYFATRLFEMVPGINFQFGEFLSQKHGVSFPRIEQAPRAVYVFDATGGKTDTWHDRGMENHGPYSAPTFTPTEPRICVVCQRAHKGRIEQFVRKFLHGITIPEPSSALESGDGPKKRQPFKQGFIRKFALKNASVEFFEVDGDAAVAYRKAVLKAIESQTERKMQFDLALVETEERFHNLAGNANPYLVSKAEFMSHQIAVQEFEFETTSIPDSRLQFVLNNMALATYAKLGGTPWLVKANLPIAHELVFGLGSARIGEGRLGENERIVGITTVFTGEGNYCVSTLSKAVSYENYQDELLESLKVTVERVSKSRNWEPKDHVRLVFHAFKPFKKTEEETVKALMKTLGDYDVEYAFLHVVEDHAYQFFDELQSGVKAYDGSGGVKGKYAPERSRYLRLSGHESLITLTGPSDLKQASDGMPRPILLRLGRGSTFTDMTYLTRQVNTFACHSWRSYFPSPLPVTVMYSELIARVLGKLSTVPHWNPSQMLGSIRETCWFL